MVTEKEKDLYIKAVYKTLDACVDEVRGEDKAYIKDLLHNMDVATKIFTALSSVATEQEMDLYIKCFLADANDEAFDSATFATLALKLCQLASPELDKLQDEVTKIILDTK